MQRRSPAAIGAMRKILFPLIFGLVGTAMLAGLGIWQLQRLAWKEGVLAAIGARMTAPPVALPDAPEAVADQYRAVKAKGELGHEVLRVLASTKQAGAIYRLIAPFKTDGRKVLIDLGGIPAMLGDLRPAAGIVRVTGNLHWPDERSGSTPEPDMGNNIWFARDVPAMAQALGTEPVLIVARRLSPGDPHVTPMPVDTSAIANDHLGYAITWFTLAATLLGMTGVMLWRINWWQT